MADSKLNSSINVFTLESLKLKILWVLDKLTSKEADRFSVKEITDYLIEKLGISTSRQAVTYAINADKKSVHGLNGRYKLMQYGKDLLAESESKSGVILIEPGRPFSTKLETIETIFSKLNGDIKICDPYCGVGVLELIFRSFKHVKSIKILTQHIIDKPSGSFIKAINDLKTEGFNIEIKIYGNNVLHDRYILTSKDVWLSGYGFNDLGKKESFIISLGQDINQSLTSTYNNRWKIARPY